MKRIVVLGPPGTGKGTQAVILAKKFDLSQLAPGDILRAAAAQKTSMALKAKEYMDQGLLVPNQIIIDLIIEAIKGAKPGGYILDGFPRTIQQAEALTKFLADNQQQLDRAIFLDTPDDVIVERLASRRSCKCGAIYNLKSKPPITADTCDHCGSTLFIRSDDKPETIKVRQEQYRKDTKPLIAYYTDAGLLSQISGDGSQEEITSKILQLL